MKAWATNLFKRRRRSVMTFTERDDGSMAIAVKFYPRRSPDCLVHSIPVNLLKWIATFKDQPPEATTGLLAANLKDNTP